MKTVCEVVVQDILPTLRAAIAKELISSYNLNQGEVAKLIDVSQPAVSQYLRQLRGKTYWTENDAVSNEIKKLCDSLHSRQIGADELGTRMCAISKLIIESRLLKNSGFHKVDSCMICR